MQRAWLGRCVAAVLAGGSAGCSTFGSGGGGNPQLGSLGTPGPSGIPAPAAPERVAMGSFLEGPVGSRLSDADRETAFKAENEALAMGERRPWRGAKGVYGYVVPGAPGSGAPAPASGTDPNASGAGTECRTFTHTVYFGGRPQVGHGTGCQDADGTWRIVS